jgi:hemolysin III
LAEDTGEEAAMPRRIEQTEEFANAASHGLGCLLAIAAWPTMTATATTSHQLLQQAGLRVFTLTMLLMFLSSALFHAAPDGEAKRRLRRLDHAAIFLFIAGSSTPFALGHAEQPGQLPLLGLVWAVALTGTVLKLADRLRQPVASTLLYLCFGWLAAAAVMPFMDSFSPQSLWLLVAGGLAYSIGCGFYLAGRYLRYGHLVWHLMVIVGSTCHLQALIRSAG